jgi:hypothetical protein
MIASPLPSTPSRCAGREQLQRRQSYRVSSNQFAAALAIAEDAVLLGFASLVAA